MWMFFFTLATIVATGKAIGAVAVRADAVKLQNRVCAHTSERDERDARDEETRVKGQKNIKGRSSGYLHH